MTDSNLPTAPAPAQSPALVLRDPACEAWRGEMYLAVAIGADVTIDGSRFYLATALTPKEAFL